MIDVMAAFISGAISKLFNTSVDVATKNINQKKTAAAKLLELHVSLTMLADASNDALEYFRGHAFSPISTAPAKTVARQKLDALLKCSEEFSKQLMVVRHALSIHGNELVITLLESHRKKGSTLGVINLLLLSCPRPEQSQKSSFILEYPSIRPERLPEVQRLADAEEVKTLVASIRKNMKFNHVDIRDQNELAIAMKGFEDAIKQIEEARRQLSEFIKENFKLEHLLG
jgi:hypothetical protein